MEVKFIKTVSKGSRFNQIYIPRNMGNLIGAGDEVEVRLVKKGAELHYSKNLKKLSEFKEGLIRNIFSFLSQNFDISAVFVVGSFLTEKIGYNDIDIAIITRKDSDNFEETAYNNLIEKFNVRLHVLAIEQKRFQNLLRICPLTRAMFSKFICSAPAKIPGARAVDKRHIKFLLMMPYDLLELKLNSRAYFDNIRRLITIERFLECKNSAIAEINNELKSLIKGPLHNKIRLNEEIEENSYNFLKDIIRKKLKLIEMLLLKNE